MVRHLVQQRVPSSLRVVAGSLQLLVAAAPQRLGRDKHGLSVGSAAEKPWLRLSLVQVGRRGSQIILPVLPTVNVEEDQSFAAASEKEQFGPVC